VATPKGEGIRIRNRSKEDKIIHATLVPKHFTDSPKQ
jgi:hypothetical protein